MYPVQLMPIDDVCLTLFRSIPLKLEHFWLLALKKMH